MQQWFPLIFLSFASVVFSSCALIGLGEHGVKSLFSSKKNEVQKPGRLPAKAHQGEEQTIVTVDPSTKPETPGSPAIDSGAVVFTDADDPDKFNPELERLLTKSNKRKPWETEPALARRFAYRDNKLIMIWFTSTKNSPLCKRLSDDVFSKPGFESFAEDSLIRLRINTNVTTKDIDPSIAEMGRQETVMLELRDYVDSLCKKFGIVGTPVVVLMTPDGKVLRKFNGYKAGHIGSAEYYFDQLQKVVDSTDTKSELVSARNRWQSKGYRTWKGTNGMTFLAKFLGLKGDKIALEEPDGNRIITKIYYFDDADQKWLAENATKR